MTESIIVALIAAVGGLLGTYFANKKTTALVAYRLDKIEEKLDKHNHFDDRISACETDDALHEQELKRVNERLKLVEGKVLQ